MPNAIRREDAPMIARPRQKIARRTLWPQWSGMTIVLAATTISACGPSPSAQSTQAPLPGQGVRAANADAATVLNPPGGHPLSANPDPEEYGEFLARPEELLPVSTNDIAKSIRLNATATAIGREVYAKNCASCHGADLKGSADAHAPDLTDGEWRFSGDDLDSGGETKLPSDVEWTVRYGIRSGHPNARGVEADMLAFDPQYRNEHDLGDYGKIKTVTEEEIEALAEYVLQLSGQQADMEKASRGRLLFHDNAKGNCTDCHNEDATGEASLGSTNLTRKELYLFGSDKASIAESISKGRRGVMPGFGEKLKPEEIKAVSVYVFSQAKK
jgi:cbb3-type cytochrome c oxidase subunit III